MKIRTSSSYGSSLKSVEARLSDEFLGIKRSLSQRGLWGRSGDLGQTITFNNGYVRITAKGLLFGVVIDIESQTTYALLGAFGKKLENKLKKKKGFTIDTSLTWVAYMPKSLDSSKINFDHCLLLS